jgi:uncharacterized protein YqhQ
VLGGATLSELPKGNEDHEADVCHEDLVHRSATVGGQAVVEGVMMRAPAATGVAVRKADGSLVVRVRSTRRLAESRPWLGRPGLRGVTVLLETLVDGMSALNFSAEQAMPEEAHPEAKPAGGKVAAKAAGTGAIVATLVLAMAFGFFMFAVAPHLLTNAIGWLVGSEALAEGRAVLFHLVDGLVKVLIFLGFVWTMSHLKDMRRVFQYHGAEHQAVHAYEAGLDLTPEALSRFPTAHARCGTAFLVTVIVVSIFVFAGVFPLLPVLSDVAIVNQLLYVGIKAPLVLPIAGLSYEVIRLAGRTSHRVLGRIVSAPGVWFQGITTQRPDRGQQEIAIAALRSALAPAIAGVVGDRSEAVLPFASFDEFQAWAGDKGVPA